MFVDAGALLGIFDLLENNCIDYVLLRNIGNELPEMFEANKDIDLLIRRESRDLFQKTLLNNGWKRVKHPWDFGNNFVFLYSMDKLEFYEKDSIHLDICYQLCCRSINKGEWMPLDQMINQSVWENRIKNTKWNWYQLSSEDELVHLLTRCIFDKKIFSKEYQNRIDELMAVSNTKYLKNKLNLVFFLFSEVLLEKLVNKTYISIIESYYKFCDY